MGNHSTTTVRDSRADTLQRIKTILDAGNVECQFESIPEGGKIISFLGNHFGNASEFIIEKSDKLFASKTGCKAKYLVRSRIHEKQITAYQSVEHALIEIGLKLCINGENGHFYTKYAAPYNERFKNQH